MSTPVDETVSTLLGRGQVDGLTPAAGIDQLTDPELRREKLLSYCDVILGDLEQNYLPGPGKADEPGHFTNYRRRSLVETTPLTIDLAQDMHDELSHVRSVVASAPPASDLGASPTSFGSGIEY